MGVSQLRRRRSVRDFAADGVPRELIETAIACGLFITALQWMGLAILTHTPQPMRFLNRLLDRPTNERPYILFHVGYPAADCRVPAISKKAPADVTTWYTDV